MSNSEKFIKLLGEEVAEELGNEFKFFRSREELRRSAEAGHDVIVFGGSSKYSPEISISFYVGKNFKSVKKIEKALGDSPSYYHIQQYSPNIGGIVGHPYTGPHTWSVDVTNPPKNLTEEFCAALKGIGEPFFERFSTIRKARDGIVADNSWCFGGLTSWRNLLYLDIALDDLSHFKTWSEKLSDFEMGQANEILQELRLL